MIFTRDLGSRTEKSLGQIVSVPTATRRVRADFAEVNEQLAVVRDLRL